MTNTGNTIRILSTIAEVRQQILTGQTLNAEATHKDSPNPIRFRLSINGAVGVGDGIEKIDFHTYYEDHNKVRYAEFIFHFQEKEGELVTVDVPDFFFKTTW